MQSCLCSWECNAALLVWHPTCILSWTAFSYLSWDATIRSLEKRLAFNSSHGCKFNLFILVATCWEMLGIPTHTIVSVWTKYSGCGWKESGSRAWTDSDKCGAASWLHCACGSQFTITTVDTGKNSVHIHFNNNFIWLGLPADQPAIT